MIFLSNRSYLNRLHESMNAEAARRAEVREKAQKMNRRIRDGQTKTTGKPRKN